MESYEILAKQLVDNLMNYLPGSRDEVRKVGVRLMNQVLEARAYEMLSRKYALQGSLKLEPLIKALENLQESEVKGLVEEQGKVYAKKVLGRPKKLVEHFDEALKGEDETKEVEG